MAWLSVLAGCQALGTGVSDWASPSRVALRVAATRGSDLVKSVPPPRTKLPVFTRRS
jgi:hypothetical protein